MRTPPTIALLALLVTGCAGPLDTVRPVQPPSEPEPELAWPDYVSEADVELLNDAERRIADVRQGELLVHVVDASGAAVRGLAVRWVQESHDFRFGVEEPFDPALWGHLLRIGVNHAAATLDWEATEPEPNLWTVGPAAAAWGLDVLPRMGVTTRGAAAVWLLQNRTPEWVRSLKPADLLIAVEQHVRTLASTLGERVAIWEALREPNVEWASAAGRDADLMLEVARAATIALRDVAPLTPVMINFANPLGERQNLRPLHFSERLRNAGVEFDIIGLQYYYNGYTNHAGAGDVLARRNLADIAANLDDLALVGKRLHVTGVSVPARPHPADPTLAGYWGRRWSPELQATYLKAFYVVAFANEAVDAITWRDAIDRGALIEHGGLFTPAGDPKPAFWALRDLLAHWRTEGDGKVDELGEVRLRGFGGDYRIVVSDPITHREVVATAHVHAGQLATATVVVPPGFEAPDGSTPWVVVKRSTER